mmetsp:Transcript_33407/g.85136  ORF Transcript_33407/g.85136 Transcript_33407/m.85136 type:complete len:782 (+) Transcript_33407:37-2382(+)|eukprot:CAMPEP_0183467912 /NCGR_PEP_ID=MMETSP0370-20130417/151806_1 /TAXON_ID=268820 /ORGANISM="Peridinium aciculiferum, Strain PAER-2" /LENGTH=781 /DNA_ID=CAMNT_0025660279 /DNA_START=47 /DNA_END=2392 /DNA_ORIENTATION=-
MQLATHSRADVLPGVVPSLLLCCVQKLAHKLIKYGPKKVRLAQLSVLHRFALEALLDVLVVKNALNDNVLPYVLTRQTQRLCLEGCSQLRRCLLNTIGHSCPNLRVLDVRGCQQVDNRIVRDVLQNCEHLSALRLEGCTRISDTAFAPALWKPPLAGLLGLEELSIGKCGQVTAEGLLGCVMKGAPLLKVLGLAFCRLMVTDDVAAELLFNFGLESLDLSGCSQITDVPFRARSHSMLRELHVASTQISDAAIESFAPSAPNLEVFNAASVIKLSDRSIVALADSCKFLRTLCICNTQVTDAAFEAIVQCRRLECLDASWCVRATARALEILAGGASATDRLDAKRNTRTDGRSSAPCLRELKLEGLGGVTLDFGPDVLLARPDPWKFTAKGGMGGSSPTWMQLRLPADPPSLLLPPPATILSPPLHWRSEKSMQDDWAHSCEMLPPSCADVSAAQAATHIAPSVCLKNLTVLYGRSLEQVLLDGVRNVVDAPVLQAIADNCPLLQQLALSFSAPVLHEGSQGSGQDCDAALGLALRAVGAECRLLSRLSLDSASRPHRALIAPLAPPSFPRLTSLSLCCSKSGGLLDQELELILGDRVGLETLELRNCEGISEGLFSKWCHRESHDEARVVEQLDQALLSSLTFGYGGAPTPSLLDFAATELEAPSARLLRRRQHPRCAAALALRSVSYFSLGGVSALSDRSTDALAELLHDAQTVKVWGCALLTEDALRSFRKGCRYLRSVAIVTRDRTLSWTAATSGVKRHRHRRSSFHNSGSSGTDD